MQFQVSHPVGVFEIPVVIERRLADVDGHHSRSRIRVGKHRRLVGTAAGNEDVYVGRVAPVGPEHPVGMGGIKPLPVAGQPGRQVEDGLRVDPPLILP